MLIFKDLISGDELMSDSYDMNLIDGVVYEVNCSMITLGALEINTGANASAEEAEEGIEGGAVRVNNVVNSFRLRQTTFDKKTYFTHLKAYMKIVKEKLMQKGATEAKIAEFEKGASTFAKKIVKGFKEYDFYVGESMDLDGMVVLMNYREDGVTPYVTIWKHGLTEMKV